MRSTVPVWLEDGRVRGGPLRSDPSEGTTGAFFTMGPKGEKLAIISSNGDGWEHVSVSCKKRTPNWDEMCFVKNIFWAEDECVIQYHPPKADYVNCHPFCLHLWKPIGQNIPTPPSVLVGPKGQAE